jgi:hypothetical protein
MSDRSFNPRVYKKDGGNTLVLEDGSSLQTEYTSATTATLTVTAAAHAGRTVVLNRAGGIAVTLPAATGTGNKYKFIVGTALSAASHTIAVASNTDYMRGVSIVFSDNAANAVIGWATADTGTVATESDTITLDGSTKSGYVGTVVELEDIASAVFAVRITGKATGTEATPFSVAV